MHVSAFNGSIHVLRFLLAAASANPRLPVPVFLRRPVESASGYFTPCYAACRRHRHDCVRVLLALGAAPDHSMRDGECTCPDDIINR